jgi:putative spermidine/putrescine transport system permease protein
MTARNTTIDGGAIQEGGRWQQPGAAQMRRVAAGTLTVVWCGLVYLFLLLPLVVIIGASFDRGTGYATMVFPPEDVTIKWYLNISGQQYRALGLSLGLAALTALLSCLFGVPAALGLVRGRVPGKAVLSTLFRMPLQIPTIVIGISFLNFYYVVARAVGWSATGTFAGLVIAHFFYATPYVIGTTVAILQRFDVRLEEAARTLGANRWRTFRRVTLPMIAPGIYAGAMYSFMVSFGDVPISMFLTNPSYTTYPVELFFILENAFDPSIMASATLVIVFSMILMLLVQRMVGLDSLLRSAGRS